ncbi:MAG: sulfur oxidation protein SoxY [Chitinophagales bacterium]|nr:sulfur oxidation protein SoxY [Hyphomicrobiales bacterium]
MDCTRREFAIGCGALAIAAALPSAAYAITTPEEREAAIREATRGTAVTPGRVTLGIPQVAENGLSVFTTVTVESQMTEADHVRAIHLISEKNPLPRVVSFHLGPRAGRAKVSTNIRLANSQRVLAIAEMSDGTFWSDEKSVIVSIGACIDGG